MFTVECKWQKEEGSDDVKYCKPLVFHSLLSKFDCHKQWKSHSRQDEEKEDSEKIEEDVTQREPQSGERVNYSEGEGSDQGGSGGPEVTTK